MADALKKEFNLTDVELISGGRGEFTVWLGEELLVKKSFSGFPTPEDAIAAMKKATA